ncbi:MAG: Uma2 family endonuclease [Chromatiaceae bacterium]
MAILGSEHTAPVEQRVYRLTVDAYHRMIDAGVFGKDDRVELVEGELRAMPPIDARHAGKVKRLNQLFSRLAAGRVLIAIQDLLALPDYAELQPDLMLLQPRQDFYEGSIPTPADTLLVVEVSDRSLGFDRDTKLALYAVHGVPEAWLVDLKNQRLQIFRDPGPDGYRQILLPDKAQSVAPLLLPDLEIPLRTLWY